MLKNNLSLHRKPFAAFIYSMLIMFLLTACGKTKDYSEFEGKINSFCDRIAEIDENINSIDTSSDTATDSMLENLDSLDSEFKAFAEIDFPESYDYLEKFADEASEYMTEAVNTFSDVYTNTEYDEETLRNHFDYAEENYNRAFKRVRIIITFLHGETPEDVVAQDDASDVTAE